MKDFAGRVAVVTGGGSGMGRELVRQLAAEACNVAICNVPPAGMAETQRLCEVAGPPQGLRVTTHIADASDAAQVERFRDEVADRHATDKIHLLFNNAGIGSGGSMIAHSREEWERTFNICRGGVYHCTRAFLPMLQMAEAGHIVNTSSVNGFWASVPSPHQPRRRRDCYGELVQIDGSEHAWLEDRAEKCTLLAFVDDATGRLMHLRFVASESTFDYFRAIRTYLETHGKPVAFYSDKHSIFRVNAKEAAGGDGATQFGRALAELNIDILCANSPQAKGRVERAFGTLQDRLVKELRLAGISTVAAANAWLPGFVEDYNKRFGREPANPKDLHRPLTEADDLEEILAWREERTVTRNLTLRYDRMMLLLDPTLFARGLAGKKIEVVNYPDGRFAVRHEGVALPFRVLDKIQTVAPGAIVENKRLGEALAFARELQASYPPNRRRGDPRRQRPLNNLRAPGMPTKGRPSRKVLAAAAAE